MPSAVTTLPRRAAAPALAGSPRAVLVVMCAGYFLVLLDVTIVNVALPTIASGLGASVSDLQWVVDGYALALASLMLAGGTIGDLRGHKRVVMACLVNVPIVVLALAATAWVVRESTDPQGRELDRGGVALGAAFLAAGTFAFIEGGRSGPARRR